ncbi:MAG: hypothetical protein JO321_10880 [Solirubrobacterales bacterium]|nr:hypothetical protein [Solirubrobacterales bacterium]MBV9167100.1 hypothetical protein [Solirubrobacterales bacterium]MBV9535903.1 hypothetical protein [Solirubrobacterales bacterium]
MFVSKAAVVGAGTMGGEIAQAIANADIPVVLKDIEQRYVERGIQRARSLWRSRVEAGEMNLTGESISAQTAYELGLAHRVVRDHELLDTALLWARRLAGQAPLAVQQIKRVSAAQGLDAGIEAEQEAFAEVFGSKDAREGIGAFLEKRTARFSGR